MSADALKEIQERKLESQNFDAIAYILESWIEPIEYMPKYDTTPMHFFSANGMKLSLNYCAKLGVDINSITPEQCKEYPGGSSLHVAVASN